MSTTEQTMGQETYTITLNAEAVHKLTHLAGGEVWRMPQVATSLLVGAINREFEELAAMIKAAHAPGAGVLDEDDLPF